jgi:hypothetical protein
MSDVFDDAVKKIKKSKKINQSEVKELVEIITGIIMGTKYHKNIDVDKFSDRTLKYVASEFLKRGIEVEFKYKCIHGDLGNLDSYEISVYQLEDD